MAVKIRLTRIGRRDNPNYRIVVCDERVKRDGKYIEKIGFYDPFKESPNKINLNKERLDYWLKKGAQPSDGLRKLIKKTLL